MLVFMVVFIFSCTVANYTLLFLGCAVYAVAKELNQEGNMAEPEVSVKDIVSSGEADMRSSAPPVRAIGNVASNLITNYDVVLEDQYFRNWQDRAACQGVDPDLFFPERGESTEEAKEVCRGCTVRSECLELALQNGEKFGIWGGLSERERRRVRRQRAKAARAALSA